MEVQRRKVFLKVVIRVQCRRNRDTAFCTVANPLGIVCGEEDYSLRYARANCWRVNLMVERKNLGIAKIEGINEACAFTDGEEWERYGGIGASARVSSRAW